MTETDNVLFTAMTHNPALLHLDEEYMKGTAFGQRIAADRLALGRAPGARVDHRIDGLGELVADPEILEGDKKTTSEIEFYFWKMIS